MATLHYFHDPMCSWCWGYRPVSDRLFASLPAGVILSKTVGGLAPDSDLPMPENLRIALPRAWQKIHDMLGTEFNFDFWTECAPRRSTYPSCRAVLAAEKQNRYDEMTDAIQRAYYLRAMNPSDLGTLQQLAEELGLDGDRFAADIQSQDVEADLQRQVEFARQSPIDGFPSLVLEKDGSSFSITRDYADHRPTLEHVERLLDK
ncbi:MAG: DsbA family protein [Woeseiaceae bacterium]